MQVSCKVSYSILVYIERQGAQLDSFFEAFEAPVELYKDPSGWLPAEEMEEFMLAIAKHRGEERPDEFFREVGRSNHELRAWGVLDSVLKMVESPRDIFAQPDRFLSYFLTPPPALKIEDVGDHKVTFRLAAPVQANALFSYLVGAVEGLPTYMGRPLAQIEQLEDQVFTIRWFDDQQSLFDEQERQRRQLHPEIVHSVIQSFKGQSPDLTSHPSNGEDPALVAIDAFEKMVALEVEKRLAQWFSQQQNYEQTLFKIKNDFYKMYDYFTRAQQIITLISPTARKASVREAQRRVDWEHVQREFPVLVESACDSIIGLKEAIHLQQEAEVPSEVTLQEVDLNELIDQVVEGLSSDQASLEVDRQWHLDKPLMLERDSFARALNDVLANSLSNSSKNAKVKIVTRTAGPKVQVEIQDASPGLSEEAISALMNDESGQGLCLSNEIIQRHRGQLSVSSRQGEGSTYLIELPS
jgi:signal transduction histidine kinase